MSTKKKPVDPTQMLEENRQRQRQEFTAKIERATEVIKSEIEKFGAYPQNDGKLTLSEFCRRASIPPQTLHSPNHKATTLPFVKEFIEAAIPKKTAKQGRAKSSANQEITKWKEKFKAVNEMLELAVRERNLQEIKLVEATSKINELEMLLKQEKKNGKR